MTRASGFHREPERSTYRVGDAPRYRGMAIYRFVLGCLFLALAIAGAVALLLGVEAGHPALIAGYVLAGLTVCFFLGSFLPDAGGGSTDPGQGTDFAVQNTE